MLGKDEAQRIAEAFLGSDPARWGNRGISEVVTGQDGRRLCIYGVDVALCWVCYVASRNPRPDGGWIIASSDVVLVDMASGRVVYSGSAGDEG